MGLITCNDCGGKVSKEAKACPHCGNTYPYHSSPECRDEYHKKYQEELKKVGKEYMSFCKCYNCECVMLLEDVKYWVYNDGMPTIRTYLKCPRCGKVKEFTNNKKEWDGIRWY